MLRLFALLISLALPGSVLAQAAETTAPPASDTPSASKPSESKSLGHRLLFYIPNRVFDVLDLVRLRLRVGPGLTVGVRATELADVNVGSHATIFVGLHGPRSTPQIPWPVGLETFAGVEVSVADLGTDEGKHSPQYGPLEIGLGAQLAILGFDLGIEPYDALDLALGLLTLDPKGDDF
jgi:hypothetical protein